MPIEGCSSNEIRIGPVAPPVRTDHSAKYKWMVNKDNGGILVLLLVFSHPVDSSTVTFPDDVIVTDVEAPTDLIIEISLPVTSPVLQFEMEITYTAGEQEPCLVHGACVNLETGGDVDGTKSLLLENPFEYRNVTTYDSKLEYSCSLAKEFLIDDDTGETSPTIEKTCNWDQVWEPDDQIPECVCTSNKFQKLQ